MAKAGGNLGEELGVLLPRERGKEWPMAQNKKCLVQMCSSGKYPPYELWVLLILENGWLVGWFALCDP